MNLKRIRLELAQTEDFPQGSTRHGYELTVPLDANGHVDPAGFAHVKSACTVRRFWDKAADVHGVVIHTRDGKWAFSYGKQNEKDEPIFRLDTHLFFVVGDYVTVTGHDRISRAFQVVEIHSATSARG
jgi:hypothetical protein